MSRFTLREAAQADSRAVFAVHAAAFETDAEARLVDRLCEDGDLVYSQVATADAEIIGHIALSRMRAEGDGRPIRALGLGPAAVLPHRRGEGIGGALVRAALDHAAANGWQMVFLLGDPAYYRKFGFQAENAKPFASPYAGRYWQAVVLDESLELPKVGKADYAAAFGALGDG